MKWFLALLGGLSVLSTASAAAPKQSPAKPAPTFNRDVAPIVFKNCVACHHPGGTAPFSLATYQDVKKRTKLIAKVTGNRYMPPWLPEPGYGEFVGVRRLADEQVALLEQWIKAGAPEGAAADLTVKAEWSDEWQLGKPDLVVTMPQPYNLPAEGPDVYRNFVIPSALPEDSILRAMEFQPGSAAIHHAFVSYDETGSARRLDAREPEIGFAGMELGAGVRGANAMFGSWQPGRGPAEAPDGFNTKLSKGTDLVLQLHMRSTGKPEAVQPSVALYFSKEASTRSSYLLYLRSVQIDIPPGEADYAVESSYQLPVDVELLSILPHMHYLGKEAHGWAELPDGTRRELILIKRWDFNWQGDYRYTTPVRLPKGTTLRTRLTYDNSAANPRNPNQPPKRVTYGVQTSDEMGELWMQVALKDSFDLDLLQRDFVRTYVAPDGLARAQFVVSLHPHDAVERTKLAAALAGLRRTDEALRELEQAIADDPNHARAYKLIGSIYTKRNNAEKAKAALVRSVELDPSDGEAQNDLGWVLLATGNPKAAIPHLEKAVELNPNDELPRKNLAKARAAFR
jgi:hypothetical protein